MACSCSLSARIADVHYQTRPFLLSLIMGMCVRMCTVVQAPAEQGSRITGDCEPPDMDSGTLTQVL